jgi:hypothetical protein
MKSGYPQKKEGETQEGSSKLTRAKLGSSMDATHRAILFLLRASSPNFVAASSP